MADSGSQTRNAIGFAAASIVVYLLIVIGFYFLFHAPLQRELEGARNEVAEINDDVAASRRTIAELEDAAARHLAQITDLEDLLSEARQAGAELEAGLLEREEELGQAQDIQTQLIGALQFEIESGQIRVERMLDSLRVDLVNEILFDSGQATIKPDGIEILARLGEVLEQTTDKLIVVQGHTDSVQIGGRLAERFPTNWELSVARAINVTRFLQEDVGVDPRRLSASGFSEYRPREDNSTPEGRQQNRRIEILLAPLPATSFAQPVPEFDQ